MKIHVNKIFVLFCLTLAGGLFSLPVLAVNELGQSSVEHCEQVLEIARQEWPDARDLSSLDDDKFTRAVGHKREFLLSHAGQWEDIRDYVKERGIESVDATSILTGAASAGRTDIVEKLVELGMSPDGSDIEQVPLAAATQCGRTETVKTLLNLGANPNFQGVTLQDAMVLAIVFDDWEIGTILMEHGYDPCVLKLEDGRDINDMLAHMRERNADYPAVWQQVECREEPSEAVK